MFNVCTTPPRNQFLSFSFHDVFDPISLVDSTSVSKLLSPMLDNYILAERKIIFPKANRTRAKRKTKQKSNNTEMFRYKSSLNHFFFFFFFLFALQKFYFWLRNPDGIFLIGGQMIPGRSAGAFRQIRDVQIVYAHTIIDTGDVPHRLPRCPASVSIKI